jgi:hypothetical protein
MHKRIQMLVVGLTLVGVSLTNVGAAEERPKTTNRALGFAWARPPCGGTYSLPQRNDLSTFIGCLIVSKEATVQAGRDGCISAKAPIKLPANSRFSIWRETYFADGEPCLLVRPRAGMGIDSGAVLVLPVEYEKQGIKIERLVSEDKATRWVWNVLDSDYVPATGPQRLEQRIPWAPAISAPAAKPLGDPIRLDIDKKADTLQHSSSANACVSPADLARGATEAVIRQVQYVIVPNGRGISKEITVYEQIADEYVDRGQVVLSPFAKARTQYVPLTSLKYEKNYVIGTGDPRPRHFAAIGVPADTTFQGGDAAPVYNLRIVATRRGIRLLQPKALQSIFQQGPPVRLNIWWDEIGSDGKLKPTQTFNSFGSLPIDPMESPLRVAMTEQQFGHLLNDIVDDLVSPSLRFEHLIIVKGDWAAPSSVITTLKRLAVAKKKQGAFGYWMTIYSERTSAHGNAYLKAALDIEGFGQLEEARVDDAPLITEPQKLQFNVVEEAANKAIREKKNARAAAEKVTTDVLGMGETGFLMARQPAYNLYDALEQLAADLRGEAVFADAPSVNGKPIQLRVEEKVPGLRVPMTAEPWYRRAIGGLGAVEKRRAAEAIENAADALRKLLVNVQCDRLFVADKILGWAAR